MKDTLENFKYTRSKLKEMVKKLAGFMKEVGINSRRSVVAAYAANFCGGL